MPGLRTGAVPMPRRTGTPTFRRRPSGMCLKPSGPAWFLMSAPSTDSTPCRHRCPRRMSRAVRQEPLFRSMPERSDGLWKSAPMPTGWNAGRSEPSRRHAFETDGEPDCRAAMSGSSGAARRSTTRSITSLYWPASPVPFAMGRPSRNGSCLRHYAVFSADWNASPAGTGRWSISSALCRWMGWKLSTRPALKPCPRVSIPPVSS